ncbi:hypothetical protein N0346_25250, partial [Pseudomonas aeruginosa]|nr:hypothetical protein [Pseudomonas aeruginosa]
RGVGRSLLHGLIFSRVEASTKPGAVQPPFRKMSEEKKRAAIVTNHSIPAVEVFAAGHASSRKPRSKQREKAEEYLSAIIE